MLDLEELLRKTVELKASDLHLTVGSPPCCRIFGEMTKMPFPEIARDELRSLLMTTLTGEQQNRFEEKRDLDFSLEVPGIARFRANFFVGRRGEGAVFRVIPTKILSADELGLPTAIKQLAHLEKGLVLVTGPTGSGKSTTLAALIDLVNQERAGHILTVEDPIEFVHQHKRCLVNQREVRIHTESFASALRAALREDPDVILVGEMRDLETIGLAVSAAETGHLVFGTLHTSSAAQTIDRIIDVFPPHQQSQIRTQLSESVQAVVAQALIPKIGGGRAASLEIMLSTTAVRNLIREGKTFQLPSVIETNTNMGMQTAEQHMKALILAGTITVEAALSKGLPPDALRGLDVPVQRAAPQSFPPVTPAPPPRVELSTPSVVSESTPAPVEPSHVSAITPFDDDDFGDLKPLSNAA